MCSSDLQTVAYMQQTGRAQARIRLAETYLRSQGCFGAPAAGEVDYSTVLQLDLAGIEPAVAGPRRPQDRIALSGLKARFGAALKGPVADGGYGRADAVPRDAATVRDGTVVIAAITSCTNTSNPGVMLAAGLLAKKAVERGMKPAPTVKTSLTPGSRAVSRYLDATGLQPYLDRLGFAVAGYSCATCVGSSGPIDAALEQGIADADAVACAVLSGNRNFEARIHPAVRAAFLMSPPLVVAFALAGRVDIDLSTEPLGTDAAGVPVMLKDLWPSRAELDAALAVAADPAHYRAVYGGQIGRAHV